MEVCSPLETATVALIYAFIATALAPFIGAAIIGAFHIALTKKPNSKGEKDGISN